MEAKVVPKAGTFKSMEGGKLRNYLRTYRKRSGLSQQEVAAIVGWQDGGVVSHYEWGHRLPSLRTALALEVLFKVPAAQLFAGICEIIEREVEERLERLESALQEESGNNAAAAVTARKLVWLTERRMDSCDY